MADDDFLKMQGGNSDGKILKSGIWPPPTMMYVWISSPEAAIITGVKDNIGDYTVDKSVVDQGIREGFNITIYERVSYSDLTDEQAAELTHVARGALYKAVESLS